MGFKRPLVRLQSLGPILNRGRFSVPIFAELEPEGIQRR